MKEHDLIVAMREVLDHVKGKITLESREVEVSHPEVREIPPLLPKIQRETLASVNYYSKIKVSY